MDQIPKDGPSRNPSFLKLSLAEVRKRGLHILDGTTPFECLMRGTEEVVDYTEDGKPLRRRAPSYSIKELREILKSQAFKDFVALYPKETVQGDTRVQLHNGRVPPALTGEPKLQA
jgi:hypothetical protein